jgi:PEP-CTERM motif
VTNLAAVLGPTWTHTRAVGINQAGDIIGYGTYDYGQYGFLLTPAAAGPLSAAAAPEPSTWAMLTVGFAGLGFAGYRQVKKGHATLAA